MSNNKCNNCTTISVGDLSRDHELVQASYDMANAHDKHEMMYPALAEIHEKYPNLHPNLIIALWAGVNAARN
nr:hypothetical protein [Vibrio splendidus]MCC4880739.1 hypothetical protein [Vibrio splendidus]